MSSQSREKLIHIATIGKTVGLRGDLKLHIKSDFPEQFVSGATFFINPHESITLSEINDDKSLIKIKGHTSPETARKFTNANLYTTLERTKKECPLEEGTFFWFDIVGCDVYEDKKLLGKVTEIERITITDYLNVQTDEKLVQEGYAKSFLIPYLDNFIVETDVADKKIQVRGAFDILEAS